MVHVLRRADLMKVEALPEACLATKPTCPRSGVGHEPLGPTEPRLIHTSDCFQDPAADFPMTEMVEARSGSCFRKGAGNGPAAFENCRSQSGHSKGSVHFRNLRSHLLALPYSDCPSPRQEEMVKLWAKL